MARCYAILIIHGVRTYKSIPSKWKSQTKAILKEKVASYEITADEYKTFTGEDYAAE